MRGYLYTNQSIILAIMAGKIENSNQIICRTDSSLVMVTTISPASLVPDIKPAMPRNIATRAPEIALPNFCDMVPDEKIKPVDEVPFFFVAKSATSAYIDHKSGE